MTEMGWADLFSDEGLPLDVFLRYRVTIEQAALFVELVSAVAPSSPIQREPREEDPVVEKVRDRILQISPRDGARPDLLEVMPPAVAAALAYLAWPRLELYGSHVRLIDFSSDSLSTWVAAFGGDVASAESVANHVHLWDWFEGGDSTEKLFEDLGRFLADTWLRKASGDFPSVTFVTSFVVGGYGPEVSLALATSDQPKRSPAS